MKLSEAEVFVKIAKHYAEQKGYRIEYGCEQDLKAKIQQSGAVYYSDLRPESKKFVNAIESIVKLIDVMITAPKPSWVAYLEPGTLHEWSLDFAWKEWCKKHDLWPWC